MENQQNEIQIVEGEILEEYADRNAADAIPVDLIDRMTPLELTDEQIRIIRQPINPRDVRMKQSIPYLPWQVCADIFDEALGNGKWAILPISPINVVKTRQYKDKDGNIKAEITVAQQWLLMVNGKPTQYVVVSEHQYYPDSPRPIMPFESLKSSAYFRILKALGGGRELNDGQWVEAWKKKYAGRRPTVYIDAEDVLNAYDKLAVDATEENARASMMGAASNDKDAVEKTIAFLKKRYGDCWSHIVMRHARALHPVGTAASELRILIEHVAGGIKEQPKQQKPKRQKPKPKETEQLAGFAKLVKAFESADTSNVSEECTAAAVVEAVKRLGVNTSCFKREAKRALGVADDEKLGEEHVKKMCAAFGVAKTNGLFTTNGGEAARLIIELCGK